MEELVALRRDFLAHPAWAHDFLFEHRHPEASPDFHYQMIADIHSEIQKIIFLAFRGGAKSTRQEEAAIIEGCFGLFRNRIIFGSSFTRATDRLRAIKHEFETNERLKMLFGDMVGDTWNEDQAVLKNGVCLQAFGMEQKIRGVKYLDFRPDRVDFDDIEDEENIKGPEARHALLRKIVQVIMPACDPACRFRMYATPLHPEAAPLKLEATGSWLVRRYPAAYVDPASGERRAIWPARFPLPLLDELEADFRATGMATEFAQEYLVVPEDPASKTFQESMLRVAARVRTWEPTYAIYDPARTVGPRSATTGHVVFSRLGSRFVIWEADGRLMLPDQIVNDMFRVDDQYQPVLIGFEEHGLHEFALQPLRAEMTRRGIVLPLHSLKPPKGKLDFIRGLQPFFKSGEVEFVDAISSEARAQILGFPTGRMDVPNALAYMPSLTGAPVYDVFGPQHVAADIPLLRGEIAWLAVNATPQYTCAALIQIARGGFHVIADWVREGPPAETLADIVKAAGLDAGRAVRLVCPPSHFAEYEQIGLRAAAARVPTKLQAGGDPALGREEVRSRLQLMRGALPVVQVSQSARWTLNALAGGYRRSVGKAGQLTDEAVEGLYRTLMEGVEGLLGAAASLDREAAPRYALAADGRRYATIDPRMTVGALPSKDAWHG